MDLDAFLDDLASASPAPGGGAASGLVGALAAALGSMVCNLTVGRAKYADVEVQLRDVLARTEQLRRSLRQAMDADEEAYSGLMAQYRLPKDTPEQRERRGKAIESALYKAADVPLECARMCVELLRLLVTVASHGNRNAASDAGAGAHMALSAARASLLNVRINASLMRDREAAAGYLHRMDELEREAVSLSDEVLHTVIGRIERNS